MINSFDVSKLNYEIKSKIFRFWMLASKIGEIAFLFKTISRKKWFAPIPSRKLHNVINDKLKVIIYH